MKAGKHTYFIICMFSTMKLPSALITLILCVKIKPKIKNNLNGYADYQETINMHFRKDIRFYINWAWYVDSHPLPVLLKVQKHLSLIVINSLLKLSWDEHHSIWLRSESFAGSTQLTRGNAQQVLKGWLEQKMAGKRMGKPKRLTKEEKGIRRGLIWSWNPNLTGGYFGYHRELWSSHSQFTKEFSIL